MLSYTIQLEYTYIFAIIVYFLIGGPISFAIGLFVFSLFSAGELSVTYLKLRCDSCSSHLGWTLGNDSLRSPYLDHQNKVHQNLGKRFVLVLSQTFSDNCFDILSTHVYILSDPCVYNSKLHESIQQKNLAFIRVHCLRSASIYNSYPKPIGCRVTR